MLHSFDVSPGAIRNLAKVAEQFLLAPANQINDLPGREVASRVQWTLVNPAWIRQLWTEHVDRKAKLEISIAEDKKASAARRKVTEAELTRIAELVREQGWAINVDRWSGRQSVPNSVMLQILEKLA